MGVEPDRGAEGVSVHDEKEPSEETFQDRLRKVSLAAGGVITMFSAL